MMAHAQEYEVEKVARSPGRPRSAAADRSILEAAAALFAERGFEGVSFEEVAGRANVARTTVYRRWSSKAALIAEAIVTARGSPELELGGRVGRSVAEQLIDAVARILAAPDFRRMIAHLIAASTNHPDLLAVYWRTYMAPRRAAVTPLLEEARAQGLLRADADLDIVLDIIGGALLYNLLVRPGEPAAGEIKSYLLAVLHELGTGDGAWAERAS